MSDLALLIPIAAITVGPVAWVVNNWMRARHGFEPQTYRRSLRSKDNGEELTADRKVVLLTSENERLAGQVGRLEERIAVLERIVTDPAERTARDIDALR